jgi:hypothetical protein
MSKRSLSARKSAAAERLDELGDGRLAFADLAASAVLGQ